MTAVTQADLKEMAELLAAAQTKAKQIKNASPQHGQLAYEAMEWSEYLLTFEREASSQALYWKADES